MAHASACVSAPASRSLDRLWLNIISEPGPSAPHILVSLMETPEEIIPFDKDYTEPAAVEWNLCLVGYSVGKHPYYEALKETAMSIWKLKGTFQLIALTDGFFLFKFSLLEDYDMVWSKGAWFFHGKPFIFQKWTKNFSPTRENFTSVPIWVWIHNLLLICRNSEGISKIASKIGIPIAVDALTAAKTILTYARVYIQVSTTSSFPESVAVAIEGDVIRMQIQYERKPIPCASCASLALQTLNCPSSQPSNQNPPNQNRGRSSSRNPRNHNQLRKFSASNNRVNVAGSTSVTPKLIPNVVTSPASTLALVPSQVIWVPKDSGKNVVVADHAEPSTEKYFAIPKNHNTEVLKETTCDPTEIDNIPIPNLNSPTIADIGETELPHSSTPISP
ncbi:uncharacterized protein LOC110101904 [Dendrobium catenatum]|uniref:uncharacterized protein LOC110101904 n=1 Tax=Dendrobium catenatum TaxID=906689 RepID=UPI0009F241DC|nr:uncharacterized protein LOC110101904 [Dendrobium catenatum]